MEIYTVEYWSGTETDLDKIFTSFEKAKEYVQLDVEYLSDWYQVTKWVLKDTEYQPIEITCYQEKAWQEPKPVTQ